MQKAKPEFDLDPHSPRLRWYDYAARRLPGSLLISVLTLIVLGFVTWMASLLGSAFSRWIAN